LDAYLSRHAPRQSSMRRGSSGTPVRYSKIGYAIVQKWLAAQSGGDFRVALAARVPEVATGKFGVGRPPKGAVVSQAIARSGEYIFNRKFAPTFAVTAADGLYTRAGDYASFLVRMDARALAACTTRVHPNLG